ncbi:zinc-binding dehydrogenase, partial [Xylella fastidiosa subsp. multiplex]|nr:zinc-binding dehydrogenase [Xylella fastidiosa subsp. multiplex]
ALSHLEAASLTLVGGTAWEALVGRAALRVGERILVHGGAGGVGHVAIQLAKAIGTKVFTTVRAANAEFVRGLGADEVIDYEKEDYVDAIMRLTGGQGVDVVFDTIGGDTLSRSPDVLPQLTARDQCAQFIQFAAVLPGKNEVVAGVLAPGLDQVLRLGDIDDRDDAAQLRQ